MLLRTDGGRSVKPRGRFRGVSAREAAFILVESVLAVASIESRFSAGIGAVVAMVGSGGLEGLDLILIGLNRLRDIKIWNLWIAFLLLLTWFQ